MADSELDRARAYRDQQTARAQNRRDRERALKGDPELRRQLQEKWDPVRRDPGWIAPTSGYDDD